MAPSSQELEPPENPGRFSRVPDGEFDFLGYTFGRMYSPV